MKSLIAVVMLLAARAAAGSEFLDALHRADARDAADPERIEFATRAIRAWTQADGAELRSHAYFRRGEAEAARQDDAAAEADFTKTLEFDPRNERALFLRGRALLALGRGAAAERDLAQYTAGRADDGEGWLAVGEARVAQGLPRAGKPALEALQKAKELLGDDPRPWLAEGRAHLAASRPLQALNAFEAALERAKDLRPDALSWRARAKYLLRNAKGAREDLTQALPAYETRLEQTRRTRGPARAEESAREGLADLHLRRGQTEELLALLEAAIEDYRQACELGHPAACARLADLTKKPPEAPRPAPVPKKKRKAAPQSDSGERIYAN